MTLEKYSQNNHLPLEPQIDTAQDEQKTVFITPSERKGHPDWWYKDTLLSLQESKILPEAKEPPQSPVKRLIDSTVSLFQLGKSKILGGKPESSKLTESKTMPKAGEASIDQDNAEKVVAGNAADAKEDMIDGTEVQQVVDQTLESASTLIGDLKAEAEAEYQQTKNPLTKAIIDLTTKLEVELNKEKPNWNTIMMLVRQLAIDLVKKMEQNDSKMIDTQIEFMRNSIDDVKKTYGGFWDLGLGILAGSLSIAGGAIGLGGGFGQLGGISKGAFDSLKGVSDALGGLGQGSGKFQELPKGKAERDRQVYQFELERERNFKGTGESSLQANRSDINSKLRELGQSFGSSYDAFRAMAQ